MKRLMGGETEYGLSATRSDGRAIDQSWVLRQFIDFARAALPYTSTSANGRFLSNGGLLYLDHGLHIEWATPECTSPHDLVRFLRAGDSLILLMAGNWRRQARSLGGVFCTRCNVDYDSRTLWASHESYLHHGQPADLPAAMVPFLVSRVVLAGAGGWNCHSPGLEFTLSPRAHFISEVANGDTQHIRPIFHTKNETLSRTGSHRLHVSCSETLCSDVATFLRFGSTALVLALAEARLLPGGRFVLASPVSALRSFAADPDCRMRVGLANGADAGAIEIQRYYLDAVERHVDRLPDWTESVCTLWRRALDDLEQGGSAAAVTLDWAIKRRIYAHRLTKQGLSWNALEAWNSVINRMYRSWHVYGHGGERFTIEAALAASTMTRVIRRIRWVAERRGLCWDDLPRLAEVRRELFEIDTRFGALDEAGLFRVLDGAGVLKHRVAGVDTSGAALDAPTDTRAHVRGAVVRRLSQARTRYGAEWTGVYDYDHQRELDLGDPFELEERWRDAVPPRPTAEGHI